MIQHHSFNVETSGKGLTDITERIVQHVSGSGLMDALCSVYVCHTSASVVIQENADPDVLTDLADWYSRNVLDGDPLYRHVDEGTDDMSAHIRSSLGATQVTIPVCAGALALGTWQGIYLFEHRHGPMSRKLVVTLYA
jgi:secondary thiamine-phosphate synthase enzyme